MEPVHLTVATPSRRYAISIGYGNLDRLPQLLDDAGAPQRRFVVSSPTVWRLHGQRLVETGFSEPILVPDGERSKQLQTVSRIYETLIQSGADRAADVGRNQLGTAIVDGGDCRSY